MVVSLRGLFAAPSPALPHGGRADRRRMGWLWTCRCCWLISRERLLPPQGSLPLWGRAGEGLLATRSMVVRAIFLQVFLRHRKRKCRRCPSPTGGGRPSVEGAIVAESPPPLQDALASAAGEGAARGVFFQLSMRPPSCLWAKENGHLRGRFPCELFQSVFD